MEQAEHNTPVRVAYARDLRTEHEILDSENPMGHNAEKPTKVPTQHGHTNRTHEAECEPLDSRHNETRNMNMNSRVQTQNNRHEYR